MSAKTKAPSELVPAWEEALLQVFDNEYAVTYAKILSDNFIDKESPAILRTLGAAELAEMKIPIGHRQMIIDAAKWTAVTSLEPESTRGAFSSKPQPDTPVVVANALPNNEPIHEQVVISEGLQWSKELLKNKSSTFLWNSIKGEAENFATFEKEIMSALRDIADEGELHHLWSAFKKSTTQKIMPRLVNLNSAKLVILRVPDISAEGLEGTTIASSTNRVVVWWPTKRPNHVYTFHRCHQDVSPFKFFESDFQTEDKHSQITQTRFLAAVCGCALRLYRQGIASLQAQSDSQDDVKNPVARIEALTAVQKKASVYLRCLRALNDLFKEIQEASLMSNEDLSELTAMCANLDTVCTELDDNANATINMEMALDGFRAGANMKIFTYLSVICQPISVATGWYGMNFANMPDLLYDDAYYVFIGIVCGISVLILTWLIIRNYIMSR